MKTIIDKNYGADIDGNRGIAVTEYELDDDDFDEVVEQILDMYPDADDIPDYVTVTIEGIDFEVDVCDYL